LRGQGGRKIEERGGGGHRSEPRRKQRRLVKRVELKRPAFGGITEANGNRRGGGGGGVGACWYF